jgi:dienelactone hydrolase
MMIAATLLAGLARAGQFTIEVIDANPKEGFNFPYVLRLPEKPRASHSALIVETNNTGNIDSFGETLTATKLAAAGNGLGPLVSEWLDLPLLMPVFPRTKADSLLYTHALSRDTILIEEGKLARLDRQLLAMVADARAKLAARNLEVAPKFLICGFSASGTFANRFAFLHPKYLLAVVAGGINAFPMLPVSRWHGARLDYPLGTNDLPALAGTDFDMNAWRSLPQMLFMGTADDNDAVQFPDAYSRSERATIYRVIGKPMALRWETAQRIYLALDPHVTFVTYGRTGHATDNLINRDVIAFFDSVLADESPRH